MNAVVDPPLVPVEKLPDDPKSPPEEGIAICLSGGGYRAMLFHLGAVWRLAELGFLGTTGRAARKTDGSLHPVGSLQRISSVSGGSLVAGVLGLKWVTLEVDRPNLVDRYIRHVVEPIR